MEKQKELMKSFFYDGHLHSHYSDGLSSPAEVVDGLVAKGLSIVGVTDHNTVGGIAEFREAVVSWQDKGKQLLFVPGVEVMTKEGFEVITLVPDNNHWNNFEKKYGDKPILTCTETIKRVAGCGGFAVFVHPEMGNPVPAVKLAQIAGVIEKLTSWERKLTGIEIYNGTGWMMPNNQNREGIIKAFNLEQGLAEFGFSDAHHCSLVGSCVTELMMKELTPAEMIKAITENRVKAVKRDKSVADKIKELVVIGSAVVYDRAGIDTRKLVNKALLI